jgi:hypothetical protein
MERNWWMTTTNLILYWASYVIYKLKMRAFDAVDECNELQTTLALERSQNELYDVLPNEDDTYEEYAENGNYVNEIIDDDGDGDAGVVDGDGDDVVDGISDLEPQTTVTMEEKKDQ